MKIRDYAKAHGHKVVGKLTRKPEWERARGERWYMDDDKNEYFTKRGNVFIITKDGGVF